jgi:Sec-independent protein translocase protein TatA
LVYHSKKYSGREKDNPKSFTVESDQDGKFTFIAAEKVNDGIYKLWAEAVDERGAKSKPTEKLAIAVKHSAFLQTGLWTKSLFAVAVSFIAFIILLLFGWNKFSMFRKKLKKEVYEAESVLRKEFNSLKDRLPEQVKMLKKTGTKRELTQEEEKVIKHLKKDLDGAEKFVKKEIKDIEREIK